MDLMKAIKTRRSIRKYSTEQVSNIDLEDIVELASYSPSWKNSQTVGYVIIRDHDLLNRIAEEGVMGFTHNTGIIKNCQALVVLTTIKGHCGYEKDGSFSTKKKMAGKCLMPVLPHRPSSLLHTEKESAPWYSAFSMKIISPMPFS